MNTPDIKLLKAEAAAKAAAIWRDMDENERTCVRIGLFPQQKMDRAIAALIRGPEGADPYPPDYVREVTTALSVALMDIASANGGMIA